MSATVNADLYVGSSASESILTLDGDDTIYGGFGDDTIDAGLGNDLIFSGEAGTFDLVYGGDGKDIIFAASDIVHGGLSDDFIAVEGAAIAFGDEGNDTLQGGSSNSERLFGGAGADVFLVSAGSGSSDVIADFEDGIDRIDVTNLGITNFSQLETFMFGDAATSTEFLGVQLDGAHSVLFTDTSIALSADDFIFAGSADATAAVAFDASTAPGITVPPTLNLVTGTNGDDVLVGTIGDDSILADAGNDDVAAQAGNDIVFGGSGEDTLIGYAGNDLLYGNQNDDVLSGGTGLDTMFGGQSSDRLAGGDDADILYGNMSDDMLYGDDGADTLFGGQAGDILYGGAGADVLFGNNGTDTLSGEIGDDLLFGGNSPDTFIFGAGFDHDTIADLEVADQINLVGLSLENATIFQTQTGVVIDFGNDDTLTLSGVTEFDSSVFVIT